MTNTEARIQKATAEYDKFSIAEEGLWFNAKEILGKEDVTFEGKQFNYVLVSNPFKDGKRRVMFATNKGKAVYKLTEGNRLFPTKSVLEKYLDFHTELYQEIADWYNDTLLPAVTFIKEQKAMKDKETEDKGGDEPSIELVESEEYAEGSKENFVLWNRGRTLGQKEMLLSEISSIKYQIRMLQ